MDAWGFGGEATGPHRRLGASGWKAVCTINERSNQYRIVKMHECVFFVLILSFPQMSERIDKMLACLLARPVCRRSFFLIRMSERMVDLLEQVVVYPSTIQSSQSIPSIPFILDSGSPPPTPLFSFPFPGNKHTIGRRLANSRHHLYTR